jgi:hypothetical protein
MFGHRPCRRRGRCKVVQLVTAVAQTRQGNKARRYLLEAAVAERSPDTGLSRGSATHARSPISQQVGRTVHNSAFSS